MCVSDRSLSHRCLAGVCFPSPSTGRLGLHRKEMGLFWEGRAGMQEGIRTGSLEKPNINFLWIKDPINCTFCSQFSESKLTSMYVCICIHTYKYRVNTESTLALALSCPLQHPCVLSTLLEFTHLYADNDGVRSWTGQKRHLHWTWINPSNPGCVLEKYYQIKYFIMQQITANIQSLTFKRKSAAPFFFKQQTGHNLQLVLHSVARS